MLFLQTRHPGSAEAFVTHTDRHRIRSLITQLRAAGGKCLDPLIALKHRLNAARGIERHDVAANVITLNSRVQLRHLDSGREHTLTLVNPVESNLRKGELSVAASQGMALLGKRVGQIVHWTLGSKPQRYRIERVLYQPEAAGDDHL